MVERKKLVSYLNELLDVSNIPDSSCNGLQVEGALEIKKIALSVDACLGVYQKAVKEECQMALVHHGIIWGGLTSITGNIGRQIEYLLKNGLNLYAVHLPLDLHATMGNNIVIAESLGLMDIKPFGRYRGILIGFKGIAQKSMTCEDIGNAMQNAGLGGKFSILPFGKKENRTIAIVSGGGSDALNEAIDNNIDCFITGESLHWNHHAALEGKINVVYCGHYHTETGGVKALGKHIEKEFGVETVFIDEPTIV
jgi:dinuclear metal center YbgI/SA1388 family protein